MKFPNLAYLLPVLLTLGCGGGSTPVPPTPAPSISISPQQPTIHVGEILQFTATVSNASNQELIWSVTDGLVTASGLFTAPYYETLVTVTARFKTNISIQGKATFNVLPAPSQTITISPSTAILDSGSTLQFSATFNNIASPIPYWSTFETGDQPASSFETTSDGRPLSGTITGSGLYSAPLGSGQFSVMVSDAAHISVNASIARLTVNGWGPVQRSPRDLPFRPDSSLNFLQDGTVLIAGGEADAKSAMIYDPSSNSIVKVLPMTANRAQHTATVLQDGSIFMAGGGGIGTGGVGILSTTEIYDPGTQSFKAGPDLPRPTIGHQSILLEDGRVLIVGGMDGFQPFYECLVFDPTSISIKTAASLSVARVKHRLVRLPGGTVLIIAGGSYGRTLEIEAFDPATDTVHHAGTLIYPHNYPSVFLRPDGKVLIAGDIASFPNELSHVSEIFDPILGLSTEGPDMYWGRGNGLLVDLGNGKYITTGGNRIGGIELYDSESNKFTPVASTLQAPFKVTSAVRLGGTKVMLVIEDDGAQTLHTEVLETGSL